MSYNVLWLLRHGEAEDGSPDDQRPLTPRGEAQSRAAGEALKALGVELEACLASPRVRARDTALLACEALGLEPVIEPRLSGGPFDAEELAAGLEHVLLVGHDPDFSMAVHDLTGAQVRMKKGGLACVQRGELMVYLRPKDIERLAGGA